MQDDKERRAIQEGMRFFAFDSFQGLLELIDADLYTTDFSKGQYAASLDEFETNLSRGGVDLTKVVCVPGWFDTTYVPETIAKHQLKKAVSFGWIATCIAQRQ